MDMQEGLARFAELMGHNVESDSPSAEDLKRAVDLCEGREDKLPPEALQRFADAMD